MTLHARNGTGRVPIHYAEVPTQPFARPKRDSHHGLKRAGKILAIAIGVCTLASVLMGAGWGAASFMAGKVDDADFQTLSREVRWQGVAIERIAGAVGAELPARPRSSRR